MEAMTASRGASRAVTDAADPRRLPLPGRARGRVLRAGVSAAAVAGLLTHGAEGAERIVCVLTGHGLKDPQTALGAGRASVVPCEPDDRRGRARPCSGREAPRGCVRVPASSANLGPGFDVLAAALALHIEVEVVETGRFAVVTDLAIARDRRNLVVRGFARLHPPDDFEFRITSDIPLSGGLGTSAAAYVAGLLAADSIFELDADMLAARDRARGPPGQRRRRAARRLRDLRRRPRRRASTRPPGSRPCSSCPHRPCAPPRRARRCPPRCRWPTRSSTSPTPRCSCSASPQGGSTSSPAGSPTACTSRAARTSTRESLALVGARAGARRARRHDLRRRPDRAGLEPLRRHRAASSSGCAATARAGREVMRVPFEPQGADVRALT